MYAKIENNLNIETNVSTLAPVEWPVYDFQIRGVMTTVSLPAQITPEDVAQFGFEPYTTAAQPAFDTLTQKVEEAAPVKQDDTWVQQWLVIELYATQAERDNIIAADIEAKRIAAIPISVSPRQIRQALTRAGLRASVEAAVLAGDPDLKDWWEFSTQFERVNTQVTAMGSTLGVTEQQLDDLWILASSL